MSDAPLPPKAAWPRPQRKDSGWWFGAVGVGLAVASFFWSGMSSLEWSWKPIAMIASLLAVLIFLYVIASLWVLAQRVWYYPRLYQMLEDGIQAFDAISRHFAESLENRPSLEILRVHWFPEKKEMCLLIKKQPGRQPQPGATFLIWDEEDGRFMAVSKMIDNRSQGYYAKVTKHVDPLWLGQVRDRHVPELPPPSGVSAYLFARRKENQDHGDGE